MNETQRTILKQRVNEVLYYIWDPIGVNDVPEARNEYDSYVPEVVELLLNNEAEDSIANHLHDLEKTNMGLFGNFKKCKKVAELLKDWLNVINGSLQG